MSRYRIVGDVLDDGKGETKREDIPRLVSILGDMRLSLFAWHTNTCNTCYEARKHGGPDDCCAAGKKLYSVADNWLFNNSEWRKQLAEASDEQV